jgi:hypothetical protein
MKNIERKKSVYYIIMTAIFDKKFDISKTQYILQNMMILNIILEKKGKKD